MQPVTGAAEAFDQLGRKRDIVQRHIVVQRRVAEQHVDELPGIAADGLRGERDANLEQAGLLFGDALDPADDLGAHELVRDRRQRHLDALLDRNGACARLDRPGVAADVVDRLQTRGHGCSDQLMALGATIVRAVSNCERAFAVPTSARRWGHR